MVLLCLSYSGDGGSFHPFMPVCMPDHSHAVCQNGPGTSDHWKPADHLLHFDYATTKFSSLLYSGNKAVPEFLGFAMCLTYLLFLLVYFREYEMKNKAEQYNELIQMQLNSFQTEMTNTRKSEKKMSILRHDTRHHLSVLRTLIQQGETDKALEYLNEVSQTYDDTVIKTYCRNEMVNSVLSIYNMRFEEQRIRWEIQVSIGEKLPCSEMMFCAILSNVLEMPCMPYRSCRRINDT